MRHFPISPGSVNGIEGVYLIERMNNEKEKGEGGRGEVHDIQKLSERHQKNGPTNGVHTFSQRCGPHIRRAHSLPLFVLKSCPLVRGVQNEHDSVSLERPISTTATFDISQEAD